MIAQVVFTSLLIAVVLVALAQLRQIPLDGVLVICIAVFGAYIVWMPEHATYLANAVGIGRGAACCTCGSSSAPPYCSCYTSTHVSSSNSSRLWPGKWLRPMR